ncbi:hypothetical protein [Bacillus sp. JJ1474]|uniref:hypothetical protein n=1 Tax=Bacillus sp. JJ1474 TaxID=3122955 RepID=UPI003000322B
MSEFMKNIVQEVLKPANKPRENPLFNGGNSRFVYSKSTVNDNKQEASKQSIAGINRPNYQQKNIQKRLAGVPANTNKDLINHSSKNEQRNVHTKTGSSDSITGSISKLQKISLVQGNQPLNKPQKGSYVNNHFNEESKFIGQTRNGIKAWVYSGLSEKLMESFQRPLKSHSVGVISSEQSSIGQLFLVNEILREYSAMKYSLLWEKEKSSGFILELYEEDTAKLIEAVKTLFQKLSHHSYKPLQLFKVHSPSPWLTKQLNLNAHVDGVAVLDGINHYSSILILDRLLKKSPNINFNYTVEKGYLLLYGPFITISEVSAELLKEAERFK